MGPSGGMSNQQSASSGASGSSSSGSIGGNGNFSVNYGNQGTPTWVWLVAAGLVALWIARR